jgi:hypothetical protein
MRVESRAGFYGPILGHSLSSAQMPVEWPICGQDTRRGRTYVGAMYKMPKNSVLHEYIKGLERALAHANYLVLRHNRPYHHYVHQLEMDLEKARALHAKCHRIFEEYGKYFDPAVAVEIDCARRRSRTRKKQKKTQIKN